MRAEKMKRILIVDDAMFMRGNIKRILQKTGEDYDIIEADNGEKAVEACLLSTASPESAIDLIILDITMPIVDGLTALKEIRKICPDTKVIMCSSLDQQQIIIDSIQNGADNFIVKPFTDDIIIKAVKYELR
jgi:two-component system chemotaxis response regulator CheY